MDSVSGHWLASISPDAPRLARAADGDAFVCRCGQRVPATAERFHVANLAPQVSEIFRGRSFCSERCVRAFFLETLSELDALDTPRSREVTTDLRLVYVALALAYADLIAAIVTTPDPFRAPGAGSLREPHG